MAIFVFSSKNLTNIWAGIGAQLWAVSESDPSTHQGRITKSKSMKIGSFGVLYCSETQSLTTPFVVFSRADPEVAITNVWPERWVLPFSIRPLGTPHKQLHKDEALEVLPTLRASGKSSIGHVLPIQAITVFSPSPLNDADWEIVIERLSDRVTPEKGR